MNPTMRYPMLAMLAMLVSLQSFAGESPYRPPGTPQAPAGQAQKPRPVEQDYSYYCWARAMTGRTEYRTEIFAEPQPHNPSFIQSASEAWQRHLEETLGKYQSVGQCYEGPTARVKAVWEQGFKSQEAAVKTVHDGWHY